MTLTSVAVSKAKPRDNAYKLTDERGLSLLVTPSGGRYWRLKYRFGGKAKTLALGVFPDVSLAKARKDAIGRVSCWLTGSIQALTGRRPRLKLRSKHCHSSAASRRNGSKSGGGKV